MTPPRRTTKAATEMARRRRSGGRRAGSASSRARTRAATSGVSGHSTASSPSRCSQAHSSASSRASARDNRDLTVPGRQPERGRGLLLGQPEQVAGRRPTCAVLLAEPVDRREQPLALLAARSAASGDGTASAEGALLVQVRSDRPRRASRAPPVARLVGDDRQQPGPERRPSDGSGRSARYALTKASCTTSSASAAEPVITYAVRKAII